MTRVLAAILNFRTPARTIACLAALERLRQHDRAHLTVVLADNGSGDGSPAQLAAWCAADPSRAQWLTVHSFVENHGFAGGVNRLVELAQASSSEAPEIYWLLNSDASAEPGALDALVAALAANAPAGIAGSRLIDASGRVHASAFDFPTIAAELDRGMQGELLARLRRRPTVATRNTTSAVIRIDWVVGASMAVTRACWQRLVALDDGYFLYYEDVDYCRRAATLGFECLHVPASIVVHDAGASSGVMAPGSVQRRPAYWFQSRRRYFVAHHGLAYYVAADVAWLFGRALALLRPRSRQSARAEGSRIGRSQLRFLISTVVGSRPAAASTTSVAAARSSAK